MQLIIMAYLPSMSLTCPEESAAHGRSFIPFLIPSQNQEKSSHRLINSHDRPAFWMIGPNWPNDGEIDIIEGVNDNANNAMTLHTSDGCSITNDGAFTGVLTTSNCYVSAPGQPYNAGCDIQDPSTQSYGADFNSNGGGIIVTEWTATDINIWFFPRGTTPSDLEAGKPDPASWGEPVAQFQGSCDIQNHFADMQIVKPPSIYLSIPCYIPCNQPTNQSKLNHNKH